jgi:hypothetical protein
MRVLRLACFVAAVAAAVSSSADQRGIGPRPLVLRIDGHVGAARPGEPGLTDLTLRRGTATIPFHVTAIRVLAGEAYGPDVLDEVAPYDPNMTVSGTTALLDRLANAPADEPLRVIAYYRGGGARMLMLSGVERHASGAR